MQINYRKQRKELTSFTVKIVGDESVFMDY